MSFFISNAMADAAAPAAAGPLGGGFEWIFLLATVLVGAGFVTVLVLGRKVSNSLVAQPA